MATNVPTTLPMAAESNVVATNSAKFRIVRPQHFDANVEVAATPQRLERIEVVSEHIAERHVIERVSCCDAETLHESPIQK